MAASTLDRFAAADAGRAAVVTCACCGSWRDQVRLNARTRGTGPVCCKPMKFGGVQFKWNATARQWEKA